MGNELLISVIVPVYNAEKYIDRAIKSVLCQMDGRIELILVNDGSVDRSGEICDEYATNNPNIRVIHKENGGTSSAKNMAIKIANGRYISFMDSDDYLESSTYNEIIKVILQYEPDCIDFGWRYISDGESMTPAFHKLQKNTLLGENELTNLILPSLLNLRDDPDNFIFDFCWNKVFKAEIIRKHNILFDIEKRVWEDRTFLLRCLKYSSSYYAMDKCLYNYVSVPNSLSRRYSLDFFKIIIANFNHYRELYRDKFDFDTQYVNNYWCRAIENMIFRSLEQQENIELIHRIILEALINPQVVHWYTNRKSSDPFEKRINQWIIHGKIENVISMYKKEWQRRHRQQSAKALINRVKIIVKKILGR